MQQTIYVAAELSLNRQHTFFFTALIFLIKDWFSQTISKILTKVLFKKRLPHNPKFSFWRREAFITNRKSILEAKAQFNIFREIRFTVILIIRYISQLIIFTLQLIFLNWQPLLSYVSRIIIQIFQFSIPRYFFSFCCFRYI